MNPQKESSYVFRSRRVGKGIMSFSSPKAYKKIKHYVELVRKK